MKTHLELAREEFRKWLDEQDPELFVAEYLLHEKNIGPTVNEFLDEDFIRSACKGTDRA